MPTPVLVTPKEKMFAQVNKQRTTQGLAVLDHNEFTLDIPQAIVGSQTNRNTKCLTFPTAASTFVGPISLFYDRIDLATITTVYVVKGTALNVNDLIPELSLKLGLQFAAGYFENTALPNTPSFTLRATTESALHTGFTTIYFE